MKSYGIIACVQTSPISFVAGKWYYRSNETSLAVLSHGTIYLVRSSNFCGCGRNPMVLPFK